MLSIVGYTACHAGWMALGANAFTVFNVTSDHPMAPIRDGLLVSLLRWRAQQDPLAFMYANTYKPGPGAPTAAILWVLSASNASVWQRRLLLSRHLHGRTGALVSTVFCVLLMP
jgi:hypothetical protein